MPKRKLQGKVVSTAMQKTVVVEVETVKENPIYKKKYRTHKKYKAHAENGNCQTGDIVTIEECTPISKDKRWRILEKESEEK